MVFRDKHPDEIRIGACADYLLGKSLKEIEAIWGVSGTAVAIWIKRTDSFKLRRPRLKDRPIGSRPEEAN